MLLGTADGHYPVWQWRPCPLRLCLQYTIFHQYLYIPLLWHKSHKQPKFNLNLSLQNTIWIGTVLALTTFIIAMHILLQLNFRLVFLIKEVGFFMRLYKQEELSPILPLFRETIPLASIPSKKLPSPLGSDGNPKTLRGTPPGIACFRDGTHTRIFCK